MKKNISELIMKKLFVLLYLSVIAVSAADLPPICPNCGSKNTIVPIVYGKPNAETIQQAKAKKIICGGLYVLPDKHGCIECDFPYSPGKPPLPALSIIIYGKEIKNFHEVPPRTRIEIVNKKCYEHIAKLTVSKVKNAKYLPAQNVLFLEKETPPSILLNLLPPDAVKLQKFTENYAGKQAAIYVVGRYVCSAVILEKITDGSIQITSSDILRLPKIVQWLNFRAQQ